ncbi:MAG: amidohydrolase family protein [Coriobacteriales bacterium]|jgi:5-methylthioadenosine/S-adenosylhomocysteine deaminase|nr:amidohydrolase family protein [Coriobacteriales bacterium]
MLLIARYVIPVSSPHIENGAVLVQNGKIVDVGTAAKLKTRYPDEETKNFGLAALMPGFVDIHTHLEYSALRGLVNDVPYAAWKLHIAEKEKRFSLQDWEDSALLGALEVVRSGITTVADITTTGASQAAVEAVGLHGNIYREVGTMEVSEVDAVLDAALSDVELWRKKSTASRIRIGVAPAALVTCHPRIFERLGEYATSTPNTPVAVHLAGSQEEYEFIRYGSSPFSVHATEQERGYGIDMPPWLATGVSPVRYILNWGLLEAPEVLAIHCVQVDDEDIEKLADNDVSVVVCSRCNAQLAMGVPPLLKFLEAKLRVGLGTDSPAATDTTDMIAEMRIGLLLQRALGNRSKFLTSEAMVRFATLGAAEAIHADDKIGSLDAGKVANIIAVDLSNSNQVPTHNPSSAIVHTATQDNILMTMIDGEVVYDGHHRHDIDVERVFERAAEMRLKLRN